MKIEIMPLLYFALGSATTILMAFITNKAQEKRDDKKYRNDLIIEDRKNKFELDNKCRIELLSDLEKLNNLVGKLEHSISKTVSLIASEKEMSYKDFDKEHQEGLNVIIELESLIISKFTGMYDPIRSINGLLNQYWGNQRQLLMTDINNNKERYTSLLQKITKIDGETITEIGKIRSLSLELSNKVRNKYIS